MASKARFTGQVAEQGRCGRVLWRGVTSEAPCPLQEKSREGLQATWEGRCQSFSSLLNRLLQLGGCQALRFLPESREALSFCIHPCLLPELNYRGEKEPQIRKAGTSSNNVAIWCFIVLRTSTLCSRMQPYSVSGPQPLGE